MDKLFMFPSALFSDSEIKKFFTSTLVPLSDFPQRRFLMHSQSCNYDQETDPHYNIVNNRIDSYCYHEGDISFTADKSSNVITILHTISVALVLIWTIS